MARSLTARRAGLKEKLISRNGGRKRLDRGAKRPRKKLRFAFFGGGPRVHCRGEMNNYRIPHGNVPNVHRTAKNERCGPGLKNLSIVMKFVVTHYPVRNFPITLTLRGQPPPWRGQGRIIITDSSTASGRSCSSLESSRLRQTGQAHNLSVVHAHINE